MTSELIRIPGAGDLIGGQFELEEEIGRGGFGIVFRARQLGVERRVAVKMLMPHAMTHEGVVERFKREARLASSLTHPNSVTIFAYGIHESGKNVRGLPYIAMEYLEGETLQEFAAGLGRLDQNEAISIVRQSLASLAEAHNKGIIHRDIKPENIFIVERPGQERQVKVLDFGIAKAVAGDWDPETRERLTRTGLVAGTAEYMAPEQATGQENITPALDVYAMGCILFQLVSGRLPYKGNSPMEVAIKHISEPIPPLPDDIEGTRLAEVIRRAMAKEAKDRFADATDFIRVLDAGPLEATADDIPAVKIGVVGDEDDVDVAYAASAFTLRPIFAVAIAAGAIFLLVAVAAVVLAIASDEEQPQNQALAATSESDDDDVETEDDPEGDPEATTNAVGLADDADIIIEADKTPPETELPQSAEIVAVPTATVWRGNEALGTTPLVIERAKLGDEPLELTLRAKNHNQTTVTLDWATLPPNRTLTAELRKAGPTGKKAPVARNTPAPKKATRKAPKKEASPALFDLNSKKPATNKKKGNKKPAPALFQP